MNTDMINTLRSVMGPFEPFKMNVMVWVGSVRTESIPATRR